MSVFIKFPLNQYKGNPQYVPPLLKEEWDILFSHMSGAHPGISASYWLAEKDGQVVGRVAGIILQETREARFGWLDFVNDPEVVRQLLGAVEAWCREANINTLHGPLGFISFDRSGVLVQGFEELPTSFSCYNYPYYQHLIERAGYSREFNWVEYRLKVPDSIPNKFTRGAEMVRKRYGMNLVDISSKKELVNYTEALRLLLNESYAGLSGFTALSIREFDKLYQQFISFIPPDFIALVEDANGKIAGFGLAMPDLAKALIRMKGRFFPFGPWYIYQSLKQTNTADLLLIAVSPSCQNKGVHTLIFEKILGTFIRKGIKYVESTKELESNFHVRNLWSGFEFKQHKMSTCYIKSLS